ncbi:MAG: hypothetical protein U5K79_15210 [Cyclobacteriaceae bacterium]|nr:hypothetical protein [Cyclobacteriaceae bacterium]
MNALDEMIQFNAYPNPVSGTLFVDMGGRFIGDVTVQLVDMQGKIYYSRVDYESIGKPIGTRYDRHESRYVPTRSWAWKTNRKLLRSLNSSRYSMVLPGEEFY